MLSVLKCAPALAPALEASVAAAVAAGTRRQLARSFHSARAAWQDDKKEGEEAKEGAAAAEGPSAEELLKKEIETLKAKVADLDDKYKRSLAEAENTRRRARVEVENERQFAVQKFSKSLIQVADIFDLAAASADKAQLEGNAAYKNLYEGMTMTQAELYKVFQKHGLERFEPMGEKFDPNAHEALFELPDPSKEPGTVAVVQKCGYKLNGRTLRAAAVGVVRDQ